MSPGVMRVARVLGCLALIVGGPWLLSLLWVVAWHDVPVLQRLHWLDYPCLLLTWGSGLVGVHLLPLRRWPRVAIAAVYTSAAVLLMVAVTLSAGCAWYGLCP